MNGPTMNHDYFGVLELADGHAELHRRLGGREVHVEIEADGGEPQVRELDALATACQNHADLCERVRAKVAAEYRELCIFDGFAVWIEDDPGLLAQLDPTAATLDDVPGERYAKLLHLGAVRLYAGTDEEPGTIVLDLRFGLAEPIDYLVAAEFSIALELLDVALES